MDWSELSCITSDYEKVIIKWSGAQQNRINCATVVDSISVISVSVAISVILPKYQFSIAVNYNHCNNGIRDGRLN